MKKCSYCGAEYPDDAVMCATDQTPFAAEARGKFTDVLNWMPKSCLGLAFASGLASVPICTAIYHGGNRVIADISGLWDLSANDPNVPKKLGFFAYSPTGNPPDTISWHGYTSLFCLGALIFTSFVCFNGCQKKSHSVITAIITLGIIGLLTFMLFVPSLAFFCLLLPVLVIGVITGLLAGSYIGAALQIAVGVWLLGWFRQRKPPNERPPDHAGTALQSATRASSDRHH